MRSMEEDEYLCFPSEEGKDLWIAFRRSPETPGELQRMGFPSLPTNRIF